ncbi:hypothetical protein [Kribbella sp. NPDC004536]|uniref:hypothetical protein n=1 Tax=Kribbella sp. NPDC004536 TaxID=3364106 RepID=UPI0036A7EEBD
MTFMKPRLHKLGLVAVAAAIGAAALGAVNVEPALASSCTLGIGPKTPEGNYEVGVNCGTNITITGFSLYGSDPAFDDYRGTWTGAGATVSRAVLNEDDSWLDDTDEIYARVSGRDQFGNSFSGTTQIITRKF